jgi:broad specificity phosphatase PhoE
MTIEKGQERDPILEPTFVLMRHAARDFSEDGLSVEGERQSLRLQEILTARETVGPMLLESSPKRRTRATLRPLSEATRQKIHIRNELDERIPNESSTTFEERVRNFCHELDLWAQTLSESRVAHRAKSASPHEPTVRIACSHLDWLEAASLFLSSDDSEIEKSEPWPSMSLRIYRFRDGIWRKQK